MFLGYTLLAVLLGQTESVPGKPEIKCADSISTSQQHSGTTGCLVFMGKKPPQQEKLDSAMVLHSREIAEAVKKMKEAPFYVFLLDEGGNSLKTGVSYHFFAGDQYDLEDLVPDSASTCEISEDAHVAGIVTTFSFGRDASFRQKWLAQDDRLLRQICTALGQEVRSTTSVSEGATTYDILSKGMDQGIFLQFNPGQVRGASFEKAGARLYWKAATSGFDVDDLLRKTKTSSGREGAEAIAADLEKNGESAGAFDLQALGLGNIEEPFSEAALTVFGSGLRDMDAKWSAFLNDSEVTVGGRSRRVMTNSEFSPLVHRIQLARVTGSELVEHASSVSDFMDGLSCLGTVFAVNNNYATLAELPTYRRCAIIATTRTHK